MQKTLHRYAHALRCAAPSISVTLLLLTASCSEEAQADAGSGQKSLPPGITASTAVRDLITAVTPPASDVGLSERSDWHRRRKETLERMRIAGQEVGEEAWQIYSEDTDAVVDVRCGLLDVAAHNVPETTRAHLIEQIQTFGDDLMVRRQSAELLAELFPEDAVEILEPILRRRLRKATYPPEDKMLEALLAAKKTLGQDSSDLLAYVATDLTQFNNARHLAIRTLSGTKSEKGRGALRQLLVESGTNSYLRRLAAQSLVKTIPTEELCPLLEEVFDREADQNFQLFLLSLIEAHCR